MILIGMLDSPWLDRVQGQFTAALDALEAEFARKLCDATSAGMDQAGVTAAVCWQFCLQSAPERFDMNRFPVLAAFSAAAEALTEFAAAPHGDTTVATRTAPR